VRPSKWINRLSRYNAMIVETKPLEQLEVSPLGSQGSFDNRFVSTFGENNPTVFTERRDGGGGEGAPALISFRLTVAQNESEAWQWQVSSDRSTITDGTNGPAIDLSGVDFDTPVTVSADSWIVLEADVGEDFLVTDWMLAAKTTAEDAKELGFNDPGDPVFQNKVRLYIGKIEFEDDVPSVTQATTQPQMIDFRLQNGTFVKAFFPNHLAL